MDNLPTEILEIIFNNLTTDEKITISQVSKHFFDINLKHVALSMCDAAAAAGHLPILKYAHENGCVWNWWTCVVAARGGHLGCLKYAHENGCEWEDWMCIVAVKEGHRDVWLKNVSGMLSRMSPNEKIGQVISRVIDMPKYSKYNPKYRY